MKKTLLIILFALLGMIQVMAQEYEYVPFVREGVKWVYYYENPFSREVFDMDEGIQYYSFEMKGDVTIGDKQYKQVCLTHYLDENNVEVEDFIPVYLREENRVVFAIHPDGIIHPQCPTGIGTCIDFPNGKPLTTTSDEQILYNFNDPITLYDSIFEYRNMILQEEGFDFHIVDYLSTETVAVGTHLSNCHNYHYIFVNPNKNIEGVGFDGYYGMPLFYFEDMITGLQVHYFFSHVIENGEIIYKGFHFDPDNQVGIDEVVADQRGPQDGKYYDLMGRAVGKDLPTVPGIYIHNGKKIVVR